MIKNYTGTTLHHTSLWGHILTTQLLIDSGADVNAKTTIHSTTPLHSASHSQDTIAEMLIGKNADVNAKDCYEKTPLHFAAEAKNENILKMLINNGAHVNERDDKGNTPLHALMINLRNNLSNTVFSANIVQTLLKSPGLIINAENNDKKTPLDLVVNTKIRELLIEHGAKKSNQLLLESMKGDCTIQ